MKTKSDLQKEIDMLSVSMVEGMQKLATLKAEQMSAPDEAKKEWPQLGDDYEYIDNYGALLVDRVTSLYGVDMDRLAWGNMFKPKTGAKELAYLKFERAVRAKAAEMNDGWVADWKDAEQSKFVIRYAGRIEAGDQGTLYTSLVRGSECRSKEAAQTLLDHFGADKFLAYATGGEL